MSENNQSTAVKISLSKAEMRDVDRVVGLGYGKSRADLCRKALIIYLESYLQQEV
ncbi:hypothetical protein [Candidatus Methanoprimaticola sp. MG2]|uniref:hypothetical protein n=1 Tax=Candidatus Methanoprimaticola sp. MG2 TaxID=3228838 RepID=UPI0039C74828